MKVVLDTNVLMSALGTRGVCEALFELCLLRCELFISKPMIVELSKHLHDKFGLSRSQVRSIIAFVNKQLHRVEPTVVPAGVCRDTDDLMVLGTAKAAGAQYLVTGDRDLLVIKHYQGTTIIAPRPFYDLLLDA